MWHTVVEELKVLSVCFDLVQFAVSSLWSQLCETGRNESRVFVCRRSEFREEGINFKISVMLGKSANASCAMLLEAYT